MYIIIKTSHESVITYNKLIIIFFTLVFPESLPYPRIPPLSNEKKSTIWFPAGNLRRFIGPNWYSSRLHVCPAYKRSDLKAFVDGNEFRTLCIAQIFDAIAIGSGLLTRTAVRSGGFKDEMTSIHRLMSIRDNTMSYWNALICRRYFVWRTNTTLLLTVAGIKRIDLIWAMIDRRLKHRWAVLQHRWGVLVLKYR